MKLYDCDIAFSARRARMILAEKGIPVDKVPVDITTCEHLQEDFLRINPDATVPVLELDDGSRLPDVQAIARYVEGHQPEPCLMGRDPKQQAEIEMWQRRMEQWLAGTTVTYFHHATPGLGDEDRYRNRDWGEHNRKQALAGLSRLNDRLQHNHYVGGEVFSVADITALCSIDFAKAIDVATPDDYPHIKRWYDEVSQRPSASA